jgi:polysaccharide export outer membrane protein
MVMGVSAWCYGAGTAQQSADPPPQQEQKAQQEQKLPQEQQAPQEQKAPQEQQAPQGQQASPQPPPQGQQVLPPSQPGVPTPAAPPGSATRTEAPKTAAPGSASPNDDTFVIGPEDGLSITVWADPRLSGPFLVRSDGRISMNLIGEVMASGKTPSKLSKEIEELLKEKEILRRPQVNVQVTAINSKKYSINGEVGKPGSFPLVVPTTVLEALVNAGGFKDFANKKKIEIIRGDQRLKFNWNEVIKGKKTEQNVLLQPGDIIIVP